MDNITQPPDTALGNSADPVETLTAVVTSLNDRAWQAREDVVRAFPLALEAGALIEKQPGWQENTELVRQLAYSLLIRGGCRRQELRYGDARELIARAAALSMSIGDEPRYADALHRLASLALLTGDLHEAVEKINRSLAIRVALGDVDGCSASLSNLGMAYMRLGDHEQAMTCYNQSLELSRQLGDEPAIGDTLMKMGNIALRTADYQQARLLLKESLAMFERLGLRRDEGNALMNLGSVSYLTGDYAAAFGLFRRSATLFEEFGHKLNLGTILVNIGNVYQDVGDYSQALDHYYRSLVIFQELNDRYNLALVYKNIATVYKETYRYERALELNLQSLALREEIGDVPGQAMSLFSSAAVYHELHDTDRAQALAEKSLELCRLVRDRRTEGEVLHLLAMIQAALDNNEEAEQYFDHSLRCSRETENRSGEVATLVDTGVWYARQMLTEEGISLLYDALELATDMESKPLLLSVYKGLADAFEMSGRVDNAYRHYKMFHELERELFDEELQQKLHIAQVLHDVEQARQQAELHRLKTVELAAANERLQKLDEEKDELLGIVVHNLQNPLTGVLLSASLLQDRCERMTVTDTKVQLKGIEDSARRMHDIVRKLLDIGRIEAGKYTIVPSAFDPMECLDEIVAEYEKKARVKEINLVVRRGILPPLWADRNATAEVLDNLISNALKYSPPLTTVTVQAVVHGSALRFEIQDQGPGIRKDEQTRLFGKFARLSTKPTGGEPSTGLGLSIVKRLAEAMNGSVWCESEEGHGSAFIVELPFAQGEIHTKKAS